MNCLKERNFNERIIGFSNNSYVNLHGTCTNICEPQLDHATVKPVLSGHSKKTNKKVFKTNNLLMQLKSIAECSLEQSALLLTRIKLQVAHA